MKFVHPFLPGRAEDAWPAAGALSATAIFLGTKGHTDHVQMETSPILFI